MVRKYEAPIWTQHSPHLTDTLEPSVLRIQIVKPIERKQDCIERCVVEVEGFGVAYAEVDMQSALSGGTDEVPADIHAYYVSTHLVEEVRGATSTATKVQDASPHKAVWKTRGKSQPLPAKEKGFG